MILFCTTEYTEFHGVFLLSSRTERSVVKDLGNTMAGVNVDVHEILRRYAPLDDRRVLQIIMNKNSVRLRVLCGEN